MANRFPAHQERISRLSLVYFSIIGMIVGGTAAAWASFYGLPPVGWHQGQPFTTTLPWLSELFEFGLDAAINSQPLAGHLLNPMVGVDRFIQHVDQFRLVVPLVVRIGIIVTLAVTTATLSAIYAYRTLEPVDRLKHLKGRRLYRGRRAVKEARKAHRKSVRTHGRGIEIAPGVPISLETETKHLMLVGASGSGKTQIILSWIKQVLHRGTKLIIHDTKGDMTAGLPTEDFILLAPHDARSWAWDIGADCRGLAAARELAAQLVPMGHEPLWPNGARSILTGLIRSLQITKGSTWFWPDLQDAVFADPEAILTRLENAGAEGARYLELDKDGIPTKTSFSFLVTLWSHAGTVISPLAEAWRDTPNDRRVSLTEWLSGEDAPRALIFQRSAQYADLSEAWIGAAVQMMANHVAGAGYGDSADRQIWMFLDEFAQLGELKGFHQFLEVGRSRGIRCVLGLQDLEQLTDIYGAEAQKTWLNTIETKIVCRMNGGPSARFIAEDLIGQRQIFWTEESISQTKTRWFEDGVDKVSESAQTHVELVPVLMPDDLERRIGAKKVAGVMVIRALLLSEGDVYELDWPIAHWPERRPGSEPADWTKD